MITVSINTLTGEYTIDSVFKKELNINKDEQKLVDIVLSFLPADKTKDISLERRSKNYISMIYKKNDFLRFRYGPKAKWISLDLPPDLRDENNPLFAAQKKKSQLHWRADLQSLADLDALKDYIVASCHDFFEENPLYKLNMEQLDAFAKSKGYQLKGKTKTEKINSLLALMPEKESF